MSKTDENTTKTQQLDFVKELLEKGTVTLTAKSRDELAGMVSEIPADCSYGAGAVGQDRESGVFSLHLTLR